MTRCLMARTIGGNMPDVMLQLGAYQFSVDTAAYQDLTRSAEYRWASQERVGAIEALQFTGPVNETIEMRGVIYPYYRGGLGQLDTMRAQASLGVPLPLVSGLGRVLGLWVMLSVRETQGIFARGGVARRVEFDLSIKRYDGGLRGLLPF